MSNNKEYVKHYKDYIKYIESDEYVEGEPINYRGISHQYELNRCCLYFVDYLLDNNYHVEIKKMYNSKTVFEISKDGVVEKYEILSETVYNRMWSVCNTFEDYFRKSKFIKEHIDNKLN